MYNLIKTVFSDFPLPKKYKKATLSLTEHINEINTWLDQELDSANDQRSQQNDGKPVEGEGEEDLKVKVYTDPSCKAVHFDVEVNDEQLKADESKLTLKSHSTFVTTKANCGVTHGKWMFEVQLHSKGVMQIGWCSKTCEFSQENGGIGVGDTIYSFGYDGSKKRVWHLGPHPYGSTYWRNGDIISVCIDLEARIVGYYRNGKSLGVAFEDIVTSGPIFPAVSLAFSESLTANFGSAPFRFPVAGFLPIQDPPSEDIQKCEVLLKYLSQLATFVFKMTPGSQKKYKTLKMGDGTMVSEEAAVLIFGSMIIERLESFLVSRFMVEAVLFPFVKKMSSFSARKSVSSLPGCEESPLGCFLSLLWDHLDYDVVTKMLQLMVCYMESMYKEIASDIEYEKARIVTVILSYLCNHTRTRRYLLKEVFFRNNCLALFLYIKPPEEEVLERLIPDKAIWMSALGGDKKAYVAGCEKIKSSTTLLYNLQKHLLRILLRNDDGTKREPSSRKIFVTLFRKCVMLNCVEHRLVAMIHGHLVTPTQPAVGLAFTCLVLDVLKGIWDRDFAAEALGINPRSFYDGLLTYRGTDRVGGVVSYLRKKYRKQLISELQEDHISLTEEYEQRMIQTELNDVYGSLFVISGTPRTGYSVVTQTQTSSPGTPSPGGLPEETFEPGNADELKSIYELLDTCLLFYFSVGHKYIMMVADLRDNLAALPERLDEDKMREESDSCVFSLDDNGPQESLSDVVKKCFFNSRSKLMARKQAWYRAVSLNSNRRSLLVWLTEWVFNTAIDAANKDVLFSFLPEVYITAIPLLMDTILDFAFHDIEDQYELKNDFQLLRKGSQFLFVNLAHPRIIMAACKDAMIQSLGTLACHKVGIEAMEKVDVKHQVTLVQALLRPYENRAWGQSNWLLLRFWLGHGFAYRESRPPNAWNNGDVSQNLGLTRRRGKSCSYTGLLHIVAPASPSRYFQDLIAQVLVEDTEYCLKLLNSILGQLNWAFSEFVQVAQEIATFILTNTDDSPLDPKQVKICSMCFELTVSLLRALEMILSLVPSLFKNMPQDSSEVFLNRICQLLVVILTRTTIPLGSFQVIVDANLPELSLVNHFNILAATVGLIVALTKDEMGANDCIVKVPKVSRIFLVDPNFHIASLKFMLGDSGMPQSWNEIPRGNFDPFMGRETAHVADDLLGGIIDRALIDERRNSVGSTSSLSSNTPAAKFDFRCYPTHISVEEIRTIFALIDIFQLRQSLLSEITVFSEDSLCPICCARRNNVSYEPCHHQSCAQCIIQHLMNEKLCFYCKGRIKRVINSDGDLIYESTSNIPSPPTTSLHEVE